MNELTPAQRRELRAAAHHLKPVVSISHNGLSETVLKEIDRSLKAHELIKLRLYGIEREQRDTLSQTICSDLGCALVQHLGHLLILWRGKPKGETAQAKRRPTERAAPKGTERRRGEPPAAKPKAATAGARRLKRT